MTDDIALDDPAWPVWHPISGGLVDVDTDYRRWVQDPDYRGDLPVVCTDGNGRFLRSDHRGWWYRCTADGEFDDDEPPPGLLKLRVHLGEGIMHTSVAAPLALGTVPGAGTPYQGILRVFELPDGSVKVGEVWHFPNGTRALTDQHGRIREVTR